MHGLVCSVHSQPEPLLRYPFWSAELILDPIHFKIEAIERNTNLVHVLDITRVHIFTFTYLGSGIAADGGGDDGGGSI